MTGEKDQPKFKLWMIIPLTIIGGSCLLFSIILGPWIIGDYQNEMELRASTLPVTQETQAYLCETFKLSSWDRRCWRWREVYSHHFYGELVSHFVRQPDVTYDMVTEMIGDYELSCTYFDDSNEFVCYYEFTGRNDNWFGLGFDESGFVQEYIYPPWWV